MRAVIRKFCQLKVDDIVIVQISSDPYLLGIEDDDTSDDELGKKAKALVFRRRRKDEFGFGRYNSELLL